MAFYQQDADKHLLRMSNAIKGQVAVRDEEQDTFKDKRTGQLQDEECCMEDVQLNYGVMERDLLKDE